MFTGSGNVAMVTTDPSGFAESPNLTANGTPGSFSITASVSGLAPTAFTLTNTTGSAPPPPSGAASIWANADVSTSYRTTYTPLELGLKFRSDVSGKIAGVRFYKHYANGGTHKGSLWTADGTLLATGTFTNETASGWQTLMFSTPVPIAANTTYVASYHLVSGIYAVAGGQFLNGGTDNGPLHALAHGVAGPNGLIGASPDTKFPAWPSMGDNYWVDVILIQ